MVKFIGEYSGKVDDKGRIIFPSAFKALMPPDGDMRFVIKKDIYEECLNRAVVEPDSRFGRLSVPKKLLESIGVVREVVFSGSDHKIEVWAKEKYEASSISGEEFLALTCDILPDIR